MRIDLRLPIYEHTVITTIPSSAVRPATLKVFIPILNVFEYCWRHLTYLKLYKNSTPITQNSVIPNRTKINHHWFDHLQALHTDTLNHATPLVKSLKGSSKTPGLTQENLGLNPPSYSFD